MICAVNLYRNIFMYNMSYNEPITTRTNTLYSRIRWQNQIPKWKIYESNRPIR